MTNDMPDPHRLEHLDNHWLCWSALRHFLPAPLVRALCDRIVFRITFGTRELKDLFDGVSGSTLNGFEHWVVESLPAAAPLDEYLQRRIRGLVLQSDYDMHPPEEGEGISGDSIALAKALEGAIQLGNADLGFNPAALLRIIPASDPALEVLKSFLDAAYGERLKTLGLNQFLKLHLNTVSPPLSIVMAKHIGDLAADSDEWNSALVAYEFAKITCANFNVADWADYTQVLRDLIDHSVATANRVLKSPGHSAAYLLSGLNASSLHTRPILHLNASLDAMDAMGEISDTVSYVPDIRGIVLTPPLYHGSHELGDAMQLSADGRHDSATKEFWGILRRQIALGLSTESRSTKAQYGKAILAQLTDMPATRRQPEAFWLSMRLLIESGRASSAKKITWNRDLITQYVGDELIKRLLNHAEKYSSTRTERLQVVIEMFSSWLPATDSDQTSAVRAMMDCLAFNAGSSTASFFGNRDLGIRSLEALETVAATRPEFRELASHGVAVAILNRLSVNEIVQAKAKALQVAGQYVDVLSDTDAQRIIDGALRVLDATALGAWPVVRPALQLLVSPVAVNLAKQDSELGDRILKNILKFGSEDGTESTSLLFYLRDFDAELLRKTYIVEAVRPVIEKLRQDAQQINSSAATAQIQALLLVPSISGRDAVVDAISALSKVIRSSESRHPSISLSNAYAAVLMLVDREEEFSRDLNIDVPAVRQWISSIFEDIIKLWQCARQNPLVLASFSIPPPTRPNPVVVHNWAFASVRLAESLGQRGVMIEKLHEAQADPSLRDNVAIGIATASTGISELDADADRIRDEPRDVFYASLGRRLASVPYLAREQAVELSKALFEQCVRHGPQGIDAAVFVNMRNLGLQDVFDLKRHENYLRRVEAHREFRLSLMPLIQDLSRVR